MTILSSYAMLKLAALALGLTGSNLAIPAVSAQVTQVNQSATPGTFMVVGSSGVSAQQIFLGRPGKVYVVDKTEGNPLQVGGHPAWASEYDLATNTVRAMDVLSNTFCAGGTVLGNGTWLNVGGNQPIAVGGNVTTDGAAPYETYDGGKALRLLNPCDDETCEWIDDPALYMTTRRWYPTLETLEDGSAIIIGGCLWGGYVNAANEDNPTYEFWPSKGEPITMNLLLNNLPVNLFPLTWLLPSGMMLIQCNFATIIFDYKQNIEYNVNPIPDAVRVYPGSAATAMFPMTPANNWTATILFCGGTDVASDRWTPDTWKIVEYEASTSCVRITPDVDLTWYEDDPLDTARSMPEFVNLPDGRLFMTNGVQYGTAGYGIQSWAIGESYGDQPLMQAWYFEPKQASGSRWSKAGVPTVPRLYHSSLTLLPDGAVFVSGSNPNADYVDATTQPTYKYLTEYRVEMFYPDYYSHARPNVTGLPTSISYGGDYFNISLSYASLFNEPMNVLKTSIALIRTGFRTHAMGMGQRHVELEFAFTVDEAGDAVLSVSQLPPNPAILVPGPAMIFVVVDGIPSIAQWVMIGSGKIETQPTAPNQALPSNTMPQNPTWTRRKRSAKWGSEDAA